MGRLNSEVMAVLKTFTIFRIAHSVISRVFGVFGFLIFGKRAARGGAGSTGDAQVGTKGPLLNIRDLEEFTKKGGVVGSGGGKAVGGVSIPASATPHTPPSWKGLLLVFIVTFVGLPVVVNRVFALLSSRRTMELEWGKEGRGEQVVALHNFAGESSRELSFSKGDRKSVV